MTGVNRGGEKQHEQLMNKHESPYARETAVAFMLGPMHGARISGREHSHEYRSNMVKQYTVDELRAVLEAMDADEPVRTLRAA